MTTLGLTLPKPVKTYMETLKWEVLPHPPYSPDIAPSDYYLFWSMAHGLADQQFRSYEDIEKCLDSWIASIMNTFTVTVFELYHFFTIKLHFHQKNNGNLVVHLI